ncbi:MAG: pilus assembly protein TadG-related protein [Acidimicrobiaceae bacterium]|nr:pilus assembly protein TadG-related protein [Acidimicrobiaceae bacterium]
MNAGVGVDQGQVTILMVVVLFLVVGAALVIIEGGRILEESTRARTAADAAALAGAVEGEEVAADIASLNGGTLVSYTEASVGYDQTVATATVRVGRVSRMAKASAQLKWVVAE